MVSTNSNSALRGFFKRLFPWIVFGLGALFYIYEYVLRITPGVITTDLMSYFGINALVVSNLAAFYYYAYTPMQLPVGVLMDRFGPRRLLTIACLCCAIGSFMFGATTHLTIASIGRFLIGFGSAFAFVGVLKLATIWLPPNRFALVTGLASALGAVGAAVGFVSMQRIVDRINWHSMITLTAISGIILAVAILFIIKDKPKNTKEEYSHVDWQSVLRGFVEVIKNPLIWINGFVGCLMYLPASVFAELWGKPYLQAAHGYSTDAAASGIALVFIGFAIGAPIYGLCSDVFKNRRIPLIIGAILAASIFSIILYVPHLNHIIIDILLFFFGVSYGAQAIVFAIGRELSPGYAAATAIAVTNMFVMLSGSVFETTVGWFLKAGWDHTIVNNTPVYSAIDFTHALTVIPIALLAGIILILILRETHADVSNSDAEDNKTISDDKSLFQ